MIVRSVGEPLKIFTASAHVFLARSNSPSTESAFISRTHSLYVPPSVSKRLAKLSTILEIISCLSSDAISL